jgi:hypothetical protein
VGQRPRPREGEGTHHAGQRWVSRAQGPAGRSRATPRGPWRR